MTTETPNNSQQNPVSINEILKAELNQIRRRRGKVRQCESNQSIDDEELGKSLVGLALSGGGVRSGAMSLGVLQELARSGALAEIDYCSSVSGGSYASAYLASQAVQRIKSDQPLIRSGLDIQPCCEVDGKTAPTVATSDRMLDFIYNGQYLRDSVGFFNRQLFGMILMMLIAGSAICSLAFLVAWLVRQLDLPYVQTVFFPLGLRSEVGLTLIPSIVAGMVWFLIWCLSYWRRTSDQPSLLIRGCFIAFLFSVSLTVALIISSGGLSFSGWFGDSNGTFGTAVFGKAWGFLLAAAGASLIPFLAPRKLLQSGANPKGFKEKFVFHASSWGVLFGIPFMILMVALTEGISGHNQVRDHATSNRGEFESWGHGKTWSPFWLKFKDAFEQENAGNSGRWYANFVSDFLAILRVSREAKVEPMSNEGGSALGWQIFKPRFEQLEKLNEEIRPYMNRREPFEFLSSMIHSFGGNRAESQVNDYSRYRGLLNQAYELKQEIVKLLALEMKKPDFSATVLGFNATNASAINAEGKPYTLLLSELEMLQQQLSKRDGKSEDARTSLVMEVTRVNRLFLEKWCPEGIRPVSQVFTHEVLPYDQPFRLSVAFWSFVLFLMLGLIVNLNSTSCHNYYRDRLANMWFQDIPGIDKKSIPLAQLETCDEGFPYHLIVGSASFPLWIDKNRGRKRIDHFLFSQEYCGSERTGFLPSAGSTFRGVSLGDAVAISGAAVSVLHLSNPLVMFVLFISNLRLGQWLRNPAVDPQHEPLISRLMGFFGGVTPLRVLSTLDRNAEDRPFLFVADGGHFENLAIDELLRRRCRVILAIDAGADPDNKMTDLARLVRWARMKHGILLEAVENVTDQNPINDIAAELGKISMQFGTKDDTPIAYRGENKKPIKFSDKHHLVFRIYYPPVHKDGTKPNTNACSLDDGPMSGFLILMKSTLTGDESIDLLKHLEASPDFPHDATSDQFYDPGKFESYRALGQHLCEKSLDDFRMAMKLTDSATTETNSPSAASHEVACNPEASDIPEKLDVQVYRCCDKEQCPEWITFIDNIEVLEAKFRSGSDRHGDFVRIQFPPGSSLTDLDDFGARVGGSFVGPGPRRVGQLKHLNAGASQPE